VLPLVTLQYWVLVLTGVFFVFALLWVMFVLRNRRRPLICYVTTPNGTRRRLDFDLIEDLSIYLVTFAGYVFLALNFVVYIIVDMRAFGPYVGKGSLVVVLVLTFLGTVKRFYNSVKDKCEN